MTMVVVGVDCVSSAVLSSEARYSQRSEGTIVCVPCV